MPPLRTRAGSTFARLAELRIRVPSWAAADHVQVELGARGLQALHELPADRAAVLDEHGRAA